MCNPHRRQRNWPRFIARRAVDGNVVPSRRAGCGASRRRPRSTPWPREDRRPTHPCALQSSRFDAGLPYLRNRARAGSVVFGPAPKLATAAAGHSPCVRRTIVIAAVLRKPLAISQRTVAEIDAPVVRQCVRDRGLDARPMAAATEPPRASLCENASRDSAAHARRNSASVAMTSPTL